MNVPDTINVEKHTPSSGDIIVAKYKPYEIPLDQLKLLFDTIKMAFSPNRVIMIPDDISIVEMSKDQIKEMVKELQKCCT